MKKLFITCASVSVCLALYLVAGMAVPTVMESSAPGVLLYTTLDDAAAITSPVVGIGGTTTLDPADFVAAQVGNGAQFVGSGVVTPTATSMADRWEVGLTPAWWSGRFDNQADKIQVDPSVGWEYFLFFDQYDNVLVDHSYPFTLTGSGAISVSGSLEWGQREIVVTPGVYSLMVTHPVAYFLAEQPVVPEVIATFDTRLPDPNPPYLTYFRLTAGGVPTNVLAYGQTGYVEATVADDHTLAGVRISWRPLAGGIWQDVLTWQIGDRWRTALPDALEAGDYALRLIATDASNNQIVYTSTPGWRVVGIFGDLDRDCDVDVVDIMLVASHWHTSVGDDNYDPVYDLDGDDDIDIVDIMLVAVHWGEQC